MAQTNREGNGRRARLPEQWERKLLLVVSMAAAAGLLPAQTTVDLRMQSRNVDFSNAAATKVWKAGATLPSSCNTGEGFFLTGATPGQNLYLCTSSGTWTASGSPTLPQAGAGSAVQTVSGTFAADAVPVIDATNTEVSSGCTAAAGSMTCAAGFNGGAGATRITATEGSAPASPSSGQQTLYIDTSDHNLKSLDSGSAVRQYATIGGSETLASKTLVNPSLGASALTSAFANESVTGTVAHGLAKLTGNPATAIVASVTDTGGIVGVVTAGAGTAGTAQIAFAGQANCAFDGGTAAGDYVTVSATVAGDCHDAGATYPAAGQIVGRALSANSGTGIYPMTLFGPGLQGAAAPTGGGGSSFDPLDYTTAWVRDEMLTNNQWYIAANDGGTMVFGEPTPGFGDPAHPGIFQLETGTTSGDYSTMSLAWPNSAQIMAYPQGLVWEMRWVAKVGGLTDATYEFGFQDYGGHNALKIMFNPTLGPDWLGVSRNSDTETRVDLGVAASTSSWAKIRIRSDMTKIYFSVNGGAEQTICASGCNVTAAIGLGVSQVWPYAGVTTQTAGFAYMGVDFFAMQFSGLSR